MIETRCQSCPGLAIHCDTELLGFRPHYRGVPQKDVHTKNPTTYLTEQRLLLFYGHGSQETVEFVYIL